MANTVSYTPIFEKYFKRYLKKFPSLKQEIKQLEKLLIDIPDMGISLGGGFYKLRLAAKSKSKGKSGGFRVITYFIEKQPHNTNIKLVIIYNKSELGDISKTDLQKIIN